LKRLRLSPFVYLSAAVLVGLLFSACCVWLAWQQPWHNLDLRWQDDAAVLVNSPLDSELPPGTRITSLSRNGTTFTLEPIDFTEEPDGNLPDFTTYANFVERQTRLSTLLSATDLELVDETGARHEIGYQPRRPLSDLPAAFWVQIFVGLSAWLISATVGALRPREASARYLTLSGGCTLLFASLAAIYSTRELAMDGMLLRALSDLNFLGGILFAATLICVLWHYPKKLGSHWLPPAVLLIALLWFAAQELGAVESMMVARRLPVLLALLVSFVLSYIQWRNTRGDPLGRAALQWFLLSWVVTSTAFSALIFLPQLLGIQTGQLQGYSFLFFLFLYIGLGLGITRFRLFGLGKWWLRMLSTLATLVFLVLLDLFLVASLNLASEQALGLSLIAGGLIWLPLRNWLWQRLQSNVRHARREWFRDIVEIAFTRNHSHKNQLWQALLCRCFTPLHCEAIDPIPRPALPDSGLILEVPGKDERSALRLSYAHGGKRLFSPDDLDVVEELLEMLDYAEQSRDAYQRGVDSERSRIARDLHDNIGSRLLAGLHRKDLAAAQTSIRSGIAEMRTIVNGLTGHNTEVDVMLADLRYECESALNDANIALRWLSDIQDNPILPYAVYQNYVSIIREMVANVINHSQASTLTLSVNSRSGHLVTRIEDNGVGLAGARRKGHGLLNVQRRVGELGGALNIDTMDNGTRCEIDIPLTQAAPSAEGADDVFNVERNSTPPLN
jgi:two-component system, NarL family, sensor histidine kinase DevS